MPGDSTIENSSTVENQEQTQEQTQELASASFAAGYNRVKGIEPKPEEKPSEIQQAESQQEQQQATEKLADNETTSTAETPPKEQSVSQDQVRVLMDQVATIPELQKQIRDANGKYGALKQTIEQLQKASTAQASPAAAEKAALDATELLKDLESDFPEMAKQFKGVFSKLLARSGAVDPQELSRMVQEGVEARLKAKEDDDRKAAEEVLAQSHPDFKELRDKEPPEYKEWLASLSTRARQRFITSNDPLYVAEKLDEFKEWRDAKAKPSGDTKPNTDQQPSAQRLKNAVLPTTGKSPPPRAEPSPAESFRAGYAKAAAARIR